LKEFWARKKWESRIKGGQKIDEDSGVEFKLKVEEVCEIGGPKR
jgi:hypothetical protein